MSKVIGKAKFSLDFEGEYHDMVRVGSEVLTDGNKTQFLREAIQTYYNEAMRNQEEQKCK